MRWIDRNDLTDHNIMNNSFKGMEERIKLFSKKVAYTQTHINIYLYIQLNTQCILLSFDCIHINSSSIMENVLMHDFLSV